MRCFPIYRLFIAIGLLACVAYSNPIRVPSVRVPSPRVPIPRVPIPHVPNYSPEDTEEKRKACGCGGRKRWEGCLGHDYGHTSVDVPEDDGHHHHRRDDVSSKASADIDKSEITPEEIIKKYRVPLVSSRVPPNFNITAIVELIKEIRKSKEPPHEKRSLPRSYPEHQDVVTPRPGKGFPCVGYFRGAPCDTEINFPIEKGETKTEDDNKKGKEYPKIRTVEEIQEHFDKNRRLKDLPHEKRSFPKRLYPENQDFVTPRSGELGYEEQQALRAVNVTIEQNGKDPIAINIIIRNNSKMNVTIMARNSVVDKDSFRLGYFNISPDDTKINFAPQRQEFEWFHTQMGRYTKPHDRKYHKKYLVNDLVHLRANETYQQTIVIPSGTKQEKEQWFKMIRHGNKIKLFVEGKWFGIGAWKGEQPHWSKNLDYGFKSNTIEVQLPPA